MAYGENSPEFGALLTSEGLVAMEKGRREEALQKFRRALDVAREVYGPDSTQTASAAHNVADQLLELGQPGEALPLYREAMRARLLRLNRNHPNILVNQLKIARCECERAVRRGGARLADGAAAWPDAAVGRSGLLVAASFRWIACCARAAWPKRPRCSSAGSRGHAKLRGEDATRVERVRATLPRGRGGGAPAG
jgi:tetratricopeptide (TPR) repeat protein